MYVVVAMFWNTYLYTISTSIVFGDNSYDFMILRCIF